MLPEEKLQSIMRNEFCDEDAAGWRSSWLMSYAEYYKNRGVVRSKGYTLFAERNLPHIDSKEINGRNGGANSIAVTNRNSSPHPAMAAVGDN